MSPAGDRADGDRDRDRDREEALGWSAIMDVRELTPTMLKESTSVRAISDYLVGLTPLKADVPIRAA